MSTVKRVQMDAIKANIEALFTTANMVEAKNWQSTTAPDPMVEILNHSFTLDLQGLRSPSDLAKVIGPNLPWADAHFVADRICGQPLNPGKTWRQWPYALSANRHRVEGEEDPQFDHSYAERYFPRFAGVTEGGTLGRGQIEGMAPLRGIRSEYGDLHNLIRLLAKDPLTRQAYLPVWFPEDLVGAEQEGRRVPCTLGYHFIMREGKLNVVYFMRSCDYIRHFADDVYLTARLLDYVLLMLNSENSPLEELDPCWGDVKPGTLTMHITSLHMFKTDWVNLIHRKGGEG